MGVQNNTSVTLLQINYPTHSLSTEVGFSCLLPLVFSFDLTQQAHQNGPRTLPCPPLLPLPISFWLKPLPLPLISFNKTRHCRDFVSSHLCLTNNLRP
ncbi:Uncharacterized protein TCM_032473 [Theobroma cacao]|uniref:Uncharacterized protein n=1 Tax=Theobroma cacao TaxID=3641 RepID=A0A061FAS8_THECC|nr:Uncharacterized protein TCM_032473 [Theobroma cacao]